VPSADDGLHEAAAVFKALGHPTRLLILQILGRGPRCVCEIVPATGLDQSTVSRHLAVLHRAGVVQSRREGTMMIYSLAPNCYRRLAGLVREVLKGQGRLVGRRG